MPKAQPAQPAKSLSFNRSRLLGRAKAHEFSITSGGWSYRNREDVTMLPAHTLITGSQNVLTNTSGRIAARKGYTLDGAADTSISSILSSFDWSMNINAVRHLRGGFLTSALNDGKLQYRFVDSSGNVTWTNIITGLTSTSFNFTNYWSTTYNQSLLLMVNGAASITEWSGGSGTVASVTSNTITKQGTTTFAQNGFYSTGSHSVWIAGVAYSYTGGHTSLTLTGVTPDPTGTAVGAVISQVPETILNTATTLPLPLVTNDLITTFKNHVYVGSFTNEFVYVSKINNYKDFTQATPRVVADGFSTPPLLGPPKSFITQDDSVYISCGKDLWYQVLFTLSADLINELPDVTLLKTAALQGAQSQGLTSKMANNVIYLSNEPIVRTLGLVSGINTNPQLTDISFPIVNDINGIGSAGQIIYHKKYIYVSDPTHSKVWVYNMTSSQVDPVTQIPNHYWEAPMIMAIGRFSIIDGDLYGHSYNSSETYKLFNGYNDKGTFIESKAIFAFNPQGSRFDSKGFNKFWLDGYISSNTKLNVIHVYDLDGCQSTQTLGILGSDTQIVCIGGDDNSLGKFPLGKQPLGGNLNQVTATSLPPYFHVILENAKVPYFLYSPTFSSNGIDQQWELVSWGPASSSTSEGQADITK